MAKTPTFKETFATARGKGVKTFSWNGKKYTTELAAASKAAPKTSPKPSANPRAASVKTGSSSDASVKRSIASASTSSTSGTSKILGGSDKARKSIGKVVSDLKAKQGK